MHNAMEGGITSKVLNCHICYNSTCHVLVLIRRYSKFLLVRLVRLVCEWKYC